MLTMKDTGLVGGVPLKASPTVPVKALRGFYDEAGAKRAPGEIVLCSERFARALIASQKAERAELPKEEPAQPPAEETKQQEEPKAAEASEEVSEKASRKRGRRLTNEE